jgi:hypothetical protein
VLATLGTALKQDQFVEDEHIVRSLTDCRLAYPCHLSYCPPPDWVYAFRVLGVLGHINHQFGLYLIIEQRVH